MYLSLQQGEAVQLDTSKYSTIAHGQHDLRGTRSAVVHTLHTQVLAQGACFWLVSWLPLMLPINTNSCAGPAH